MGRGSVRFGVQAFRAGRSPRTLVLLSPVLELPVELSKDVTIVDFPLPGHLELRGLLDAMVRGNTASGRLRVALDEESRERFVTAAAGLTMQEAENAYARAMVNDAVLDLADLEIVHDEKRQTVRKSGVLEFMAAGAVLDDVGGLENLKAWLVKRNGSWLDEAAEYYQKAINVVPLPQYVTALGDIYTKQGKADEAKKQYDLFDFIARTNEVNGVNVDIEKAAFLADHDRDLAQALTLAQKWDLVVD